MAIPGPKRGIGGAWLASAAAVAGLLLACGCDDAASTPPVDAGTAGNGAGTAGGSAGSGGSGACVGAPGHEIWSQRFGDDDNVHTAGAETGDALDTDDSGNIVLAGRFSGTLGLAPAPLTSNDPDLAQPFWASFTPEGQASWASTVLPPPPALAPGDPTASPFRLRLNASHETLLSALYSGAVDFGSGPLLSTAVPVLDANGTPLPAYAAGCCLLEYATAIVKLDPSGQAVWSKRIGQSDVLCDPACEASPDGNPGIFVTLATAEATPDGGMVVSGDFQGTIDIGCGPLTAVPPMNMVGPYDGFVARLDQDGNCLWSQAIGGELWNGVHATLDDFGNIFVFGEFQGALDIGGTQLSSQGGYDVLVAKLAPDGTPSWARSFGSTGDDLIFWWQGAKAADGNITFAPHPGDGQAIDFGAGPVGAGAAVVVVRLDADGTLVWTHDVMSGGELRFGANLDVAPSGEVVLAGEFQGDVDLGGGPLVATSPEEFFVGKLAADGSLLWSERFGGVLDDGSGGTHAACWTSGCNRVQDVRLDPAGRTVLAGTFRGSLDFGSGPLVSEGVGDGYLAKLCR